MRARYYQTEAVQRTLEDFRQRRLKALLWLVATGLGKTVMAALLMRQWYRPGAMLMVAHRKELVEQAENVVRAWCPNLPVAVEMGLRKAPVGQVGLFDAEFYEDGESRDPDKSRRAVLATVQSLSQPKRLLRLDPAEVSLVIVDEGHHYVDHNVMYASIVSRFPHAKVLSITATMDRSDGVNLGTVLQKIAFRYEILEGIADGFLVPIRQQFVLIEGLDVSAVPTEDGDLEPGRVAQIMEAEAPLHKVASSCLEASGFRFVKDAGGVWRCQYPHGESLKQGILFSPSVSHAQRTAAVMNRWKPDSGPVAAAIWGDMAAEDRKQAIDAYREGRLLWLANYNVLLEGFDAPNTGIVANARMTENRALYAQMLGRGARPHGSIVKELEAPEYTLEGIQERAEVIARSPKPHLLVLDFAGCSGQHKLVWAGDLISGQYDEEVVLRARQRVLEAGGQMDVKEALEDARAALEEEKAHEGYGEAQRAKIRAKAHWTGYDVDPFGVLGASPPPATLDDEPATPKQLDFLQRHGVPTTDRMTKKEAQRLFLKVRERLQKGLCSYKQAAILQRYGLDTNVSRAEASAAIDRIASAGWPSPETWRP